MLMLLPATHCNNIFTNQISGSHQNVFTSRLIESMDLAGVKPKLLSMNEFPNGVCLLVNEQRYEWLYFDCFGDVQVKYHHDKPFMRAMQDKHEFPYNFHMYVLWLFLSSDNHRLYSCVYYIMFVCGVMSRCWTLNREEKLKYFKASHMWYINDQCALDNLIKDGDMNKKITAADRYLLISLSSILPTSIE